MIGFFIPVAEALAAGYVAVACTYLALMLVITRLGRKVLMDGDCVSNTYTALLCLTWCVASAVGAYVCCDLSPIPPWGPVLFPFCTAIASGLAVSRNMRQLRGQQSIPAFAGVLAMIVLGTVVGLYFRHAFVAIQAA